MLGKVLSHLEANKFTVKTLKCEWTIHETNRIEYWFIPTGLKPWKKYISAILEKEPPHNIKEMCSFLGAVNSTNSCGLKWHICWIYFLMNLIYSFYWTPNIADGWILENHENTIPAADVFMAYPNHNIPFDTYNNSSNHIMGTIITQQKPLLHNYHTMEKDLISTVMVLEELYSMLLGAKHCSQKSHLISCWHSFVEEYNPTICHC